MKSWEIREGHVLDELRAMPVGEIQTCITSPPYFGLRDYDLPPSEWGDGWTGCLGLEPTPDQFVAHLVEVFTEVRRVLRDDGTLWLNMGDSYAGSWGAQSRSGGFPTAESESLGHGSPVSRTQIASHPQRSRTGSIPLGADYKPKDLIGVPWLLAFALRADGWYLRSDIIWHKPNPMPESVTDRPTSAHEHLFLLAKSPRYFYDVDAIREGYAPGSAERIAAGFKDRYADAASGGHRGKYGGPAGEQVNPKGRNKRNVWTVATQPFPLAHFATFPPKLIEPCVLAGSAERACGECGAPWERVVERTAMVVREGPGRVGTRDAAGEASGSRTACTGTMLEAPTSRTVGFASSCDHQNDSGNSVVLDPFSGAGTTGLVALRHGRSFVGLELSPVFAEMARERIRREPPRPLSKNHRPTVVADAQGVLSIDV